MSLKTSKLILRAITSFKDGRRLFSCGIVSHSDNIDIKVRPMYKAKGTFGSLTNVSDEDKKFVVEQATNTERRAIETEPLIVIFGWAGATHKVNYNLKACA